MKNFNRFALLLIATAGASGLSALVVAGCSSETTNVVGDAGPDQTTSPDVQQETGPSPEAGDAGPDALPDAPAPVTFGSEVIDAFCAKIQSCCGADAGPYNLNACRAIVRNNGGLWGEAYGSNLYDGGNIVYDPVKGAQCLQEIAALGCDVTNAAMLAGRAACIGAFTGKGGAGAACRDSVECAPGFFCNLPTDGGATGTCAALRGDGGPCGDFGLPDPNNQQSQQACSYRGNGATGLTCDIVDEDAGVILAPQDWACRPQRDAGADCYWNQDCKDGLCTSNGTCGNTTPLVDPSLCDAIRITDAGTD
jgi:hypothetical protein